MKNYFEDERNYELVKMWRRDFHRHPQSSWSEFYSTGKIAMELEALGYKIYQGEDVIDPEKRLFLPDREILDYNYNLAIENGIDERYIIKSKGGLTGVVGVIEGDIPGPTIAYRFDIDALEINEDLSEDRKAVREEYYSKFEGYSHACGHDAHTAIGLLLGKYFSENRKKIKGKIKLIFQPDEEKLSGAEAMVAKGILEDVDFLIGGHIGANLFELGSIAFDVENILAVTRGEVEYYGVATHSTGRPDQGKNAILGACAAITHLNAIARHGKGSTRINVGKISGGTGYNTIPDYCKFYLETRAETKEINRYLQNRAEDIIYGAARMYDLKFNYKIVTNVEGGENDEYLIEKGIEAVKEVKGIKNIKSKLKMNASEDFVIMANDVKKRGGKSIYVVHGTNVDGGHHSTTFDFDEKVLINATWFYASMYDSLIND
ncbi:amidohydrolase [Tissierella praeacuta]|uniref:amidohydrolase n=1 Tax=Tissierella praeacuta TaxID=43131 RepID=UPI0028B08924|nr:amidohydrolase [Tissierella praeacuta]